ncbi:glycogen/starch/alpha-glucan family phosphorylase [Candidatus Methylospira mobilis]|uniref:Alpha-1,4 glucan phosphorylase n=1 Tax=Candidatus Methylospira mobilis TaxID=1808979 RepID=A0A5Q0BGU0_9GAMM|nr:glycogen/starch/alpha-glucan family phosphorylase [Candidatus Methylospira mobilis]QFY42352.1 glycogen/starch/alpha-glucan family phosphorylase [Candidatus Methylospira mobilis]
MASKGNILAVDDTPASLKLLSDLLKDEGYEVRSAINGELALKSAVSNPPELVLLDIRMPDMNGFEVCDRLKSHPKTRDVPVIFISALSETEEKVQGFGLGAVDFVTKPYQREELLARVRTHLEVDRLRNHLEEMVAERDEASRTELNTGSLKRGIVEHLIYSIGRMPEVADKHDYYKALSYAIRDRLQHRWLSSMRTYVNHKPGLKMVCYLSAEFLLGPHLGNNLLNLGIEQAVREAIVSLGLDYDELVALDAEPGLGNGGLGRLAACYLESLATLERPAIGYGIRYEFGIFEQLIKDGWQVEITDKWLRHGNPWEIAKPEVSFIVGFGGHTENYPGDGKEPLRKRWVPHRVVRGIAYDTPILGYRVNTCNTLRLWGAEAIDSFDFQAFNHGDYYRAVNDKITSETITKVLYPNDEADVGKRLRLEQQYFLVSCSLQDRLSLLDLGHIMVRDFPAYFIFQLNDTHPSLAVPEMMRLLVDERQLSWNEAWDITQRCFGYTNHTLLPEALETWSVPLLAELLPRHLEIIYEINARFLEQVRQRFPGDENIISRMSLIDPYGDKHVRMAHLAAVGSHAINGVAALHTELLKTSVLKDFYEIWPERFSNKTNGVTPRRFLQLSNPKLGGLITRTIGDGWTTSLVELGKLEAYAEDVAFCKDWRAVKQENKERLAYYVWKNTHIELDPGWLFDVHVKRIHEYKRQHLNILHIISLYCRLKKNPQLIIPQRAFIFGGKAAPGYFMAKRMIKLINSVAEQVNNDPIARRFLRVAFIPDFNVKNSQLIYPAADVSEQISTAGKEASGTGNMKFMMNGAITIGTLDGANVEIREEAGPENFFLFGLTVHEVEKVKREGYRPASFVESNPQLAEILQLIASGHFSNGDKEIFRSVYENLLNSDPFLVLADYADYMACQDRVGAAWNDADHWTRMSILNTARSGKFSSDRAIREYCDEIWQVPQAPVDLANY